MRTLITHKLIVDAPWMAAVANCDGAERTEHGITVDRDSPCYRALCGLRLTVQPKEDPCTAGTHLMRMMKQLRLPVCSACTETAKSMDRFGIEWCKLNRNVIAAGMASRADQLQVRELLAIGGRAIVHGFDFIDPRDPFGSFVDEALRRAEADAASATIDQHE